MISTANAQPLPDLPPGAAIFSHRAGARLLKGQEVCELLGISKRTLVRYANAGVLTRIKLGRLVRFSPIEIEKKFQVRLNRRA